MHFVEMDGARLTVFMIVGGLFSAAGIVLMFRAKQVESSARLELFGQKFEATSIGIVVFLIGAAFLATPMFVPEKPRDDAARAERPAGRDAPAPNHQTWNSPTPVD
jgi:drug/metabolite transporter (DMT)-like permease